MKPSTVVGAGGVPGENGSPAPGTGIPGESAAQKKF
jgi:hypothetical protein